MMANEGNSNGNGARRERPNDKAEGNWRQRPGVIATFVIIVICAIVAAVYSGIKTSERFAKSDAGAGEEPHAWTGPEHAGSEDAKLKIQACLGPCIGSMMECLVECAEAWPDKVHVKYIPYMSEEGRQLVKEHGEELACIFFNGENRFTIKEGGAQRKVHFHGPPGGEYQMADIADVLRLKMKELYDELPPDFEERAAVFGKYSETTGSPDQGEVAPAGAAPE